MLGMEGWKSCCGSGIHGAQSSGRQKMKKKSYMKELIRITVDWLFGEDSIEEMTFRSRSERWKRDSHVGRDGWTIQADGEECAKVGENVIMEMRELLWIRARERRREQHRESEKKRAPQIIQSLL